MGKGAAETVREIEATRERLDADLAELHERLPAPAVWAKRAVGVAVGGGLAGSAFWFALRRIRGKRKEKKVRTERVQAVVQFVPERWADSVADAMETGAWKTWAGAVAGVWLLLRLSEIRQLRRMNRVMLTRPIPAA